MNLAYKIGTLNTLTNLIDNIYSKFGIHLSICKNSFLYQILNLSEYVDENEVPGLLLGIIGDNFYFD